jgi:hypothetical protein
MSALRQFGAQFPKSSEGFPMAQWPAFLLPDGTESAEIPSI